MVGNANQGEHYLSVQAMIRILKRSETAEGDDVAWLSTLASLASLPPSKQAQEQEGRSDDLA